MKRLVLTTAMAVALLVPAAAIAQSPDPAASPAAPAASPAVPAASPAESMAPLGVDTMDVCLSITGPVTLLTAESLTQGIIDGTFVINGLSDACEPIAVESPSAAASPGAAATVTPMTSPEPMASPAASPAS